jgi:hypothetical protein
MSELKTRLGKGLKTASWFPRLPVRVGRNEDLQFRPVEQTMLLCFPGLFGRCKTGQGGAESLSAWSREAHPRARLPRKRSAEANRTLLVGEIVHGRMSSC